MPEKTGVAALSENRSRLTPINDVFRPRLILPAWSGGLRCFHPTGLLNRTGKEIRLTDS